MSTPEISIIIPTYNRPELLTRAILSVYAQTYTDFEIIIVDDGDTDRAEQAIAPFLEKGNCRYLETKKNVGGAVARNLGIQEARGVYVAFLDDDDAWYPDKLRMQKARLDAELHTVGFSFTAACITHDSLTYTTTVRDGVYDFREQALTDFNGFLTVTLLIRTTILHEVGGFDESLPSHQEPELIIRITQSGYAGLGINTPLTHVYISSGRTSIGTNYSKRIQGREMILKKHAALFATRPQALARSYFELGLWYRSANRWKDARRSMRNAWSTYPRLRYLLHAAYLEMHRIREK
jgi:glycosyltransferase involved in cell wall biosynthesis